MKKLIFILALVFTIVGTAAAQTASFAAIPASQTMQTIGTDYVLTNTTAQWFLFTAKKDGVTLQDFQVKIDSTTGDHTNIAIKLYGKKFSGSDWEQIGSTVNSTHTATHTVTSTIENTVYNGYRFYKAEFTPTGTGTSTIDQMIFKQWK